MCVCYIYYTINNVYVFSACTCISVLNKLVNIKKFLVFYEILICVILKTVNILLIERMINETTRIKAESL